MCFNVLIVSMFENISTFLEQNFQTFLNFQKGQKASEVEHYYSLGANICNLFFKQCVNMFSNMVVISHVTLSKYVLKDIETCLLT